MGVGLPLSFPVSWCVMGVVLPLSFPVWQCNASMGVPGLVCVTESERVRPEEGLRVCTESKGEVRLVGPWGRCERNSATGRENAHLGM